MLLTLPDWVEHPIIDDKKRKRQTIFSVHVHPDGSRLATGGLDQKVRIWATEPIIDAELDGRSDIRKLLSAMTRHSGSVLVVRWSTSGRYLASGSDDTVCLIWELDPTGLGGGSFGSFGAREEEVSSEAWRTHRRLAAHESDVVDLAWSPDEEDSYLATVGLDSRVIIWAGPRDGPGGFDRLRVITGHQGFVKGVVWDPIGQYLATASDDKTVKIWRVGGDWGLVKTVSKPFASSRHTFFRRASWSPDGAYILCANANSGPIFVSTVIGRDEWTSDINFVGHENAVAVTAFSPRLVWDPLPWNGGERVATSLMALGSLDQSISIWMAGHERPIAVARDLFQLQIMDLSWSNDGMSLYACSADGYIAAFTFTPDDLSLAPLEELGKAREVYGYAKHQDIFKKAAKSGRVYTDGSGDVYGSTDRPNMLVARKAGVPRAVPHALPTAVPKASSSTRLQQQITLTHDGKRRIRPTLLNGDNPYESEQGTYLSNMPSSSSDSEIVSRSEPTDARGAKRSASMTYDSDLDAAHALPSGKRIKDAGRTLGGDVQQRQGQAGSPVTLRSSGSGGNLSCSNAAHTLGSRLAAPPVLSFYKKEDARGSIEIRNYAGSRATEVYCFEPNVAKCSWMDFSSTGATLATVSDAFSAVSFEDGLVAVYSCKGRRLTSMQLEAPCQRLESCGDFLVVICTDGNLRRWDIKRDAECGRPVSVMSLFAQQLAALQSDDFVHFWVHPNGLPIVIMRSERAFTLDPSKMAWTLVSSGWFADCSPIWEGRTRGRGASTDAAGLSMTRRDPIRVIESSINDLVVIHRATSGIQSAAKAPADRTIDFDVAVTLKHLEARMTAASLLESAAEYRSHLHTYARKLSDEGIRNQAEDLCVSLMGPVYYTPSVLTERHASWTPTVCGLAKRELLAEVLRIMGRGRLLLGLVDTYQRLLKDASQEW